MIDAAFEVNALLDSKPEEPFIADLFTFVLRDGETLRLTNKRRPITLAGVTYSPQQMVRGKLSLTRDMSVDSHPVQINDASGSMYQRAMLGYFNLASYTLGRAFSLDGSTWVGPMTKFVGEIASVDEMVQSYVKMTAKSMVNRLDQDFPRLLVQTDCNHVLYDAGCKLNREDWIVAGSVTAPSTPNTINTGLSNADGYFNQGIISFTSGALSGISYYVQQSHASGVIYPGYPLLTTPAVGDTFSISPGCDKTMATCESKFNNLVHTIMMPFVPDPTTAY